MVEEKIFTAEICVKAGREYVRLTIPGPDGAVTRKAIAYQDFAQKVAEGTRRDAFTLGLMPEGTVWFATRGDETRFLLRVKPEKRIITLKERGNDACAFLVPYPELLVLIQVTPDSARMKEAFSLMPDTGEITEETQLYRFPFGNVSTYGSVCMGGNTIPAGKTIRESVANALTGFFYSPYNGDYYGPGNMISTGASLKDALTEINGKDTFPAEWLVKSSTTVEQLIRR